MMKQRHPVILPSHLIERCIAENQPESKADLRQQERYPKRKRAVVFTRGFQVLSQCGIIRKMLFYYCLKSGTVTNYK